MPMPRQPLLVITRSPSLNSIRQSPAFSTRTVSRPLVSVAACASSWITTSGAGCDMQLECRLFLAAGPCDA